jgi:serine/threonine protein kinase
MHDIQLESKAKAMTGFSDVFCGVYHDGTRVAVKVLREYATGNSLEAVQKVRLSYIEAPPSGRSCKAQSFRNEVVTWRHLRHPNIVPFLGVCDKSTLCLVSHWMEEGTLLDFFARHPRERRTSYVSCTRVTSVFMPIKTAWSQMLGTIRGLDFMHSLGVVHGDIKAVLYHHSWPI